MSDSHQHEPGMDEILASIRRIIADDAPADGRGGGPRQDEEPLLLTQRINRAPPAQSGEIHDPMPVKAEPQEAVKHLFDSDTPETDEPTPPAIVSAPPQVLPEETETLAATQQPAEAPKPLVDDDTVKGAASSLDKLTDVVRGNSAPPPPIHLPPEGRTLEDMLGEMLRPMIKAWLDENLSAIVEARVDEEVERISRRRVR